MPVRLASHVELEGPLKGYRLIDRLGRGGFGEVWKVEAPGGLMKAMKFVFGDLDSTDDEEGRPAEQELKALNRVKSIRHPYILSLERIDRIEGQLIIVMELADRNLWDRFKECRALGLPGIPRDELIRYMEEAAEALDLMNKHYHIQHLDVKPQNLFLVFHHIKVADFGLAKAFEGERGTVTGGVTPVYAAPETFEGYASQYTDQYSLAIVYQELLTGTRPFNGSNTKQLLMQHLNGVPDLSPLPPADRPFIGRSLNKKPDERFVSCADLVQSLKLAGLNALPVALEVDTPVKRTGSGGIKTLPTKPTGPREPEATTFKPATTLGRQGSVTATPAYSPKTPRTSISGGPLPKLVTPKRTRPDSYSNSTMNRATKYGNPEAFNTVAMGSPGLAHKERIGEGRLFPAIFIGIGNTGLNGLRQIREQVRTTFGGEPDHVQFLFFDTDPETVQKATSEPLSFPAKDVHCARLQRPAHYLQQSQMSPVEQWLPPGMLYRLPKTPGPAAGVRAFGRLALLDHYQPIASKLKQAIELAINPTVVEAVAKATGMGLRSTKPRVYFVANLAGGTGSGMVFDLAFLTKHLLREAGCTHPETVGVFLAPPADATMPQSALLANTYAACQELNDFSSGHCYVGRFVNNEPPITDGEGPFTRVSIQQTPPHFSEAEQNRILGMVACQLIWEIAAPMGRILDQVRQEAFSLPREPGTIVQSSGLYRLMWPRTEILAASITRFSRTLLKRWTVKETSHLKEPIQNWLADHWTKRHMEVATVIERLNTAVKEVIKEEPDVVFEAMILPLVKRGLAATRVDAVAACQVLDQLLKLVGKPPAENDVEGMLGTVLKDAMKLMATKADKHFATMAVSFVEQPQYRLGGAEEALAQISDRLKVSIDGLTGLRETLLREVSFSFSRIFKIIGGLNASMGFASIGSRKSSMSAELIEMLREYPRKRLQLLVLDSALGLYRSLQGSLPEYKNDIQMCRFRLDKIIEELDCEKSIQRRAESFEQFLLPPGCVTLGDVADEFIAALSPEDILGFDQRLQDEVQDRYRALVQVCMNAESSREFVELLQTSALAFLSPRLENTNVAELFFRYLADDPLTADAMGQAFDDAGPDLTTISGKAPAEATILAVPPGEDGARLREYLGVHLRGIEFIPADLDSEVAIFREYPLLPLTGIPQMANHARCAYLASLYPPHSRMDGPWINKQQP